jgi:hypothetical protein
MQTQLISIFLAHACIIQHIQIEIQTCNQLQSQILGVQRTTIKVDTNPSDWVMTMRGCFHLRRTRSHAFWL